MKGPTVLIDTREQKPYSFDYDSEKATLKTADYSMVGFEDLVAIERKSKADIFGSLTRGGNNRERFINEIERLSQFKYGVLVIEADLPSLWKGSRFCKYHPSSLIADLIMIMQDYGVPVMFLSNRTQAKYWVQKYLARLWRKDKDD